MYIVSTGRISSRSPLTRGRSSPWRCANAAHVRREIENISSRPERARGGHWRSRFRCPFCSPTGITVGLPLPTRRGADPSDLPARPTRQPYIFSAPFFLSFSPSLRGDLYARAAGGGSSGQIRVDRETYTPACDVFEALCSDTRSGSSPLFARVYRIFGARITPYITASRS